MSQPPANTPGGKGKQDRELLTKMLRHKLTEACPPSLLPPNMMGAARAGAKAPTYGECVTHVLLEQALLGKEWAVEQVLDRTEGKPVQAIRQEDADRSTGDMLKDVTAQLLNNFATRKTDGTKGEPTKPSPKPDASVAPAAPLGPEPADPSPAPARLPASRLLNLPKNRPANPQNPSEES